MKTILAWILFLWWIPVLGYEMIMNMIRATKELEELKKKTGRK